MEAVKLRQQYQRAHSLLSDLQAAGLSFEAGNSRHQELTRLAVCIRRSAQALQEGDAKAAWLERASSLHHELVSLTAHRLQAVDQSGEPSWENCVRLLYTGAEACLELQTQVEEQQAALEAFCSKDEEKRAQSETVVKNQEKLAKEILEMRTRLVVQQQDIQRREADARDLIERLQATLLERDHLATEMQALAEDCARNNKILDRQAKVISQLMEASEENVKEKESAVSALKKVGEDNYVLRVNLGQHAQVIEKLITLNAEMMDAKNTYVSVRAQRKDHTPVPSFAARTSEQGGVAGLDESQEEDLTTPEPLPTSSGPPNSPPRPAIEQHASTRPMSEDISTSTSHTPLSEFPEPALPAPPPDDAPAPRAALTSRKPVKWTSEMLLTSKPASTTALQDESHMKSSLETDTEQSMSQSELNPVAGFGLGGLSSRLQGVGGRAKGVLSYVAGADRTVAAGV